MTVLSSSCVYGATKELYFRRSYVRFRSAVAVDREALSCDIKCAAYTAGASIQLLHRIMVKSVGSA